MVDKVLVTGANGQLGKSISKLVKLNQNYDFTFATRDEFDLCDLVSMEAYFEDKNFDVVVNCAAYTAVDAAESEVELANLVNHLAVRKIAEICKSRNIRLVHISTDYVFDGDSCKPYVETDKPNPKSVYGKTKLSGEKAIQHVNPRGMIIRTSWVYSEFGNNFYNTMIRLGKERNEISVVFDQVGSPTNAGDFAKAIVQILSCAEFKELETKSALFHFGNEGVASWYDLAVAIFDIHKINCIVKPIETKDYPVHAERPYYTVMNKGKIKKVFGLSISSWMKSLNEMCVK